jgi:methylmalonyl-CoA/ethylmalonyl-CoA epimerase
MIKTIYSITIAVEDLEQAVKNYEAFLGVKPTFSLGYEVLFTECDLREVGIDFKDRIAVFQLPGIRFILQTGFDKNAPIGRFIRRKGEGVFMISMEVDNIRKETKKLQSHSKKLVLPENIESTYGTSNILHPNDMNGVIFEIIQPSRSLNKKTQE